jgi:histidinol-phosphate phosphatase family protein
LIWNSKRGRDILRAVFLDRDGVLNENRDDYIKTWAEFRFLPEALEALHLLARSTFAIVVVTNQSAIGHGIISAEALQEIHNQMIETITCHGGRIDAVLYCPHAPEANCECRKPRPGLLLKAANDLGIELSQSYCIGDKLSDLEAGRIVGCRTILVLTGKGRDQELSLLPKGCQVADDLREAVGLVLATADQGTLL